PRHRPAGRHAQSAVSGETFAIYRRWLPHDPAERATERAEAVESDVEADLGEGPIRFAQQLHCTLDPPPLQVPMWRLAERRAKLAAEVRRRGVGHARERRDVERLREPAIHRVACPQHASVPVLDHTRHQQISFILAYRLAGAASLLPPGHVNDSQEERCQTRWCTLRSSAKTPRRCRASTGRRSTGS